ncbi:beta/gamma crystallin domain-containing protein [Spongiactinospora rosea]|nr:beta/gamma crystallin domain-containing protein [Spongiactinospora rosea]
MAKNAILATLASVAMTASLTVTAPAAFAINRVDCGRSDFTWVELHFSGGGAEDWCYANRGEAGIRGGAWLDKIHTGNNRVQWFGDGRWQPAQPINKWTTFHFPNHPGGVNITAIRIV